MKTICFILILLIITTAGCKKEIPGTVPKPDIVLTDKEGIEIMKKEYAPVVKEYVLSIMSVITGKADSLMRGKPSNNFWHCCAVTNNYSDLYFDVQGAAADVNVEKLRLGNAKIRSWWIAAYYTYDTLGATQIDWVQWGYAMHKDWGLIVAFFVYHIQGPLGSGIRGDLDLKYVDEAQLTPGTRTRFEIVNVPGTTRWFFLRYGKIILDVDLGVTRFDKTLQACTESWGGGGSFPNILHVNYWDVLKNGEWVHAPWGYASSKPWDLYGKNQKPSFDLSEYETGGSVQYSDNWLWGSFQ